MRRKYGAGIFILASCLYLSFCMGGCGVRKEMEEFIASVNQASQNGVKEVLEEEIQQPAAKQEIKEQEQEERNDLEESYNIILESCSKEFIGNHLLDRTFLAWLSAEYGDACIQEIAKAIEADEQDPEIWHTLTGNTIHVLWLMYCEQTGFQQYQLENVVWKTCASPKETTFAFTGDVNFAEGYVTTRHMDACANGIYDCFSEDLLQLMNETDVMMVNNEFTYSKRGEALKGKAYTFRADPSRAELLHAFGTDIVSLANNHVYDFGPDALLDTIAALEEQGIPYVGAGRNIDEASKPCYFVCNGRKIAIVAATQIERSLNYTKEATKEDPGVLKTLVADKFVQVIKKAKKNSDIVIAVVHWGTEGDSNYGRDQYNLAVEFAAAGADAIIGGHTHCLQGFDMIEGVPVIYSLGNFWFSSSTLDTGLARVRIDENGEVTLDFIPCIQKNLKTELITEEAEKQRVYEFMQKHSASGIVVTEEGIVQQEN